MKSAAKVFIVLGCIVGAVLIFPLIIGISAYNKLETATKKDDITGWAIAVLLLVRLIGGICMLSLTDADFVGEKNKTAERKSPEEDAYEGLLRLKKLLDDGIISEEVFKEKREHYLANL